MGGEHVSQSTAEHLLIEAHAEGARGVILCQSGPAHHADPCSHREQVASDGLRLAPVEHYAPEPILRRRRQDPCGLPAGRLQLGSGCSRSAVRIRPAGRSHPWCEWGSVRGVSDGAVDGILGSVAAVKGLIRGRGCVTARIEKMAVDAARYRTIRSHHLKWSRIQLATSQLGSAIGSCLAFDRGLTVGCRIHAPLSAQSMDLPDMASGDQQQQSAAAIGSSD